MANKFYLVQQGCKNMIWDREVLRYAWDVRRNSDACDAGRVGPVLINMHFPHVKSSLKGCGISPGSRRAVPCTLQRGNIIDQHGGSARALYVTCLS